MRWGGGQLAFAVCLLWMPALAGANPHHALQVVLDPDTHSIEAEDTITLGGNPPSSLEFRLHPALVPELVGGIGSLVALDGSGTEPSEATTQSGLTARRFRVKLAPGSDQFRLRYRGRIRHALRSQAAEYARAFRTTPGMIGPEGVFLSSSSLWYPQLGDELLTFDLKVRLPDGWRSMSQGERVSVTEGGAGRWERWRCDAPQEEIYLIAGRFEEYRQAGDTVDALVMLRAPDAALARQYLDATESYVDLYNGLIGPYPYSKFALVENFWETGYGMPSFTLLGPKVIRFPFILHSSYPHEILHNWWGNGVYVDYDSGNWAEGLTSYLADHLIKEQRGEAVEYRRTLLQKYTDYVRMEQDFPLTAFRSRHSASSEAVGYGKTLMLFHMLRRQLGDARFIDGLRRLYRQYLFRVASFEDVEQALSAAAQRPLAGFFAQWVEREGAPELRVVEPRVQPRGEGYVLSAVIEQTQAGSPYSLQVPIAVQLQGRDAAWQRELRIEEARTPIELELPAYPLRLVVDPQFDVFRRLHRAEIPPAISQAVGAERVLIVLPSQAPPGLRRAYRQLAESWQTGNAGQVSTVLDTELNALPQDAAVWLFGWSNRFRGELVRALAGYAVADRGDSIDIEGTRLGRDSHAVVVMARQASNPDQALGWLAADQPMALPGLGRKLPHYGRYSYLAFTGDAPDNVLKGQWPVVDSPMSVRLPAAGGVKEQLPPLRLAPRAPLVPAPKTFSGSRMQRDVNVLASETMGGRGLGTAELDGAADYIAAQMRDAGLQPAGDQAGSWFQRWEQRVESLNQTLALQNVVGVLPGSDPRLAGESLVIGAHYDHFGHGAYADHAGARGQLHPGADDNASGVAVMLELARVLARQPQPRSIVFVAFTGEETGRLGSRRYVEQASGYPLEEAIAMLNLDTVGRLGDNPITVFGAASAKEWRHIFRGAAHVTGVSVRPVDDDFGSSDQSSFLEADVPAVQLFGGAHADIHRPGDTPDKIDSDGLVKVAAVLGEVARYLARRPQPLTSAANVASTGAGGVEPGRRVSFGTLPDFAFDGDGVRLENVSVDSPAERAGLQAGDVVVAVNEAPVRTLRDFAKALRKLAPGDEIRVRFRRAGTEQTVTTQVVQR